MCGCCFVYMTWHTKCAAASAIAGGVSSGCCIPFRRRTRLRGGGPVVVVVVAGCVRGHGCHPGQHMERFSCCSLLTALPEQPPMASTVSSMPAVAMLRTVLCGGGGEGCSCCVCCRCVTECWVRGEHLCTVAARVHGHEKVASVV